MKLELMNLSKNFKETKALIDINVTFEPGIYGLVGPNGAGKSTLFRIMATLDLPSSGHLLFNHQNVNDQKDEYRSIIGFMPQNQKGFDQFTGYAFLHYMSVLKDVPNNIKTKQIDDLVKQVSLEDVIHKKIKTYSGGMLQRLMFTQALLGDPKLVILDEPTAGLDPFERIRLRNYIRQISQDRIVIIATHVMQDIESIADRIIMLRSGSVVFQGNGDTLLKSISNKVFEKKVSSEELDIFKNKYRISRISKYENHFYIRYLDDSRRDGTLVADFEDAYLYYMTDV